MNAVLAFVALWLLAAGGVLAAVHGRRLLALWREPVLARPVLIVESDDWGPGPPADAAMLADIAATLAAIRDATGHPAVMTLGVVPSVPDGPAILAAACASYRRRRLDEREFAPLVAAIREGCTAGVFALQRHGLEHFWPAALLARAGADAALRRWLAEPLARSEALPAALQSRWVDASTLPSSPLAPADVDAAVREEAALFERVFGAAPAVAVPNTFVWDDATERAWAAHGVRWVVTPGWRHEGRDAAGALTPPTRRTLNGERGLDGLRYVVRNDYFEPSRGHRAERVWTSLAARGAQGRPTLVETHRENFVADPGEARAALGELERALRGALVRHPDLRFMSTADLVRHFDDPFSDDPLSPLLARGGALRLRAWLARVRAEASCARLLKATGLDWPLRLVGWLLGFVTHAGVRATKTC